MVQDDLAIMIEGKDGQYYLQAGSILLAGFWRLGDKLGMPLDEIHTSGDVPGYREKLAKGMNNFFARVMPGGPVIRNNVCFPSQYGRREEGREGVGLMRNDVVFHASRRLPCLVSQHRS